MDIAKRVRQFLSQPNVGHQVFRVPGVGQGFNNVQRAANSTVNFIQKNPNFVIGRLNNPLMLKPGDLPTLYGQQKIQLPRVDLTSKVNAQNPIRNGALKMAAAIPEAILNAPSDYQRGIGNIGKGNVLQGVGQAGVGTFNIATMGGGSIVSNIGKNVVKQAGIPALKYAIKQGAANGAIYGGGYGVLSGLASSNNKKEQLKQVALQGAGGVALGGLLGGGVGAAGNRIGAFKAAKLTMENAPYVPQLRDAAGRWVKGNVPVKPKGMPEAQWKFQIKFNKKYNRNPYEPVFPSTLNEAVKHEIEKKGAGLSIRDINKDKNPISQGVADQVSPIPLEAPLSSGTLPKTGLDAGRTSLISPLKLPGQLDNPSTTNIAPINMKGNVAAQIDKEINGGVTKTLDTGTGISSPELKTAQKSPQSLGDNPLSPNLSDVPNNGLPSGSIIPQLPSGEKLALPGKYLAKTPAEAKRLFKKTGAAPELDFAQKGRIKPITTPGKSNFYSSELNPKPINNKGEQNAIKQTAAQFDKEWQQALWDQSGIKPISAVVDDIGRLVNEATETATKTRLLTSKDTGSVITNKAGDTLPKNFLGNAANWKNKSMLKLQRERLDRIFEDVAGEDAPMLKKKYFEPVQQAEADRVRWMNKERADIKTLGIKGGSKEDKLLQQFGEKRISLDELKAQSPNWQKIENAEKVFRQKYDQYLTDINQVLTRNGYDPIPKRQDYFLHFQEINNVLERYGIPTKDATLPTDIAGLTADFKPGKNFFSSALPRMGDKTDFGAVQGIDRYLDGASKQIFHTDNIQNLRLFEKAIRDQFGGTTHLSNFAAIIGEYTNNLAGKKSMLDRGLENLIGRNIYNGSQKVKQQVGANMVGANMASAVTNFIPFTQSAATTSKPAFAKGLLGTVMNLSRNDGFLQKSNFLSRRFPDQNLFLSKWDNVADKGNIIFKGADRFVAESITRAKYHEGLSKGMNPTQAIKYADDYASRLIGDRSLGSMPNLFNSKTAGFLTQFQLEVNNQASFILKDIPRMYQGNPALVASAIAQVFIYSYLYNSLFEKVFGRRPAFDPIGVAQQGYEDYTNPNMTNQQATKNLAQNTLNQIPFVNTFTGGRIPVANVLLNPVAVAKGDSTVLKEFSKPLVYLPPTGGGQIKKTLQGLQAYNKGESTAPSGRVRFPIEKNPQNLIRSAVAGQWSTPEAQQYLREGRYPLGENQSKDFRNSSKPKELYDQIIRGRNADNNVKEGESALIDSKIYTTDGSTIDLTPPTTGQGIDAFTNENLNYTKAREIWKAKSSGLIDESTASQAYSKLGVDEGDVRYDYIATKSNDIKTQYIMSKNFEHDELINRLVTGRVVSATGRQFAADGVINNLRDEGLITDYEAKALKKLKVDKEGNPVSGAGRKSGKVRTAKAPKFGKAATVKIKLGKANKKRLGSVRLGKAKTSKTRVKGFDSYENDLKKIARSTGAKV